MHENFDLHCICNFITCTQKNNNKIIGCIIGCIESIHISSNSLLLTFMNIIRRRFPPHMVYSYLKGGSNYLLK